MFLHNPHGRSWPLAIIPLSIIGVFVVDLCLPLGIAGGVPYVAPVVLTLRLVERRLEIVAGICMALTVVGALLSPPGPEPLWMVTLNRAFALFAIALVLVVGRQQRRLLSQNATLQSQAAALETLYELGAAVSSLLDAKTIKQTTVCRIRTLLRCDAAGIGMLREDSGEVRWELVQGACNDAYVRVRSCSNACIGGKVIETGQPFILDPLQAGSTRDAVTMPHPSLDDVYAMLVVPIQIGEESVGALLAGRRSSVPFDDEDLHLLTAFANQVAIAINNAQLYERLGAVSTLEERDRLSRELHDGLAQVLGYVTATASTAAELAARREWHEVERHLTRLARVAQTANLDVRNAIGELKLSGALRDLKTPGQLLRCLAAEEDVEVTVAETNDAAAAGLAPAVEAQAIRILQEALRNVRKHSGVASVEARLTAAHPWLTVELSDKGQGFVEDHVARAGHFGLHTMKERAAAVGGNVTIASVPGTGTCITLRLPLYEDA